MQKFSQHESLTKDQSFEQNDNRQTNQNQIEVQKSQIKSNLFLPSDIVCPFRISSSQNHSHYYYILLKIPFLSNSIYINGA